MPRTTGILAAIAALTLTATACGGEDPSTTTLNDGADAVEVSTDDVPAGDGEDPEPGPASGTETEAEPEGAGEPADNDPQNEQSDGAAGTAIDVRNDHPVAAQPGRWAISDAGFVEFDIDDAGLVLVDITENDGWNARVDDESNDEIEVDFRRGDIDIEVEIELDDGKLEVDINTDIDPADAGVYGLGQAGSMEYALEDGRLSLRDVVVSDGWDLRMDEESSDEIEFSVTNGNERWEVEIELDDGKVELEIDYRTRDTVS